LSEAVILLARRVGGKPGAIGFVSGEAADVVNAVSDGGGTLMRGEIADEIGAAARDRLAPDPGIAQELLLLGRVDLIADEAGDYVLLLFS
jgi:hypothetical protein